MKLQPALWHSFDLAEAFTDCTEEAYKLVPLPSSCPAGERFLRRSLLAASRLHIPGGRTKDFIPNLPPSAIPLIHERDSTRALDLTHHSLPDINNNITTAIATHSRQTWIDKVQATNLQNLGYFSAKHRDNHPISPLLLTLTCTYVIAQSFCSQFTLVPQLQCERSARKLHRKIKKWPLDPSFPPLTNRQVRIHNLFHSS